MEDRPTQRLDTTPEEPPACPKCGGARGWAELRTYGRRGPRVVPLDAWFPLLTGRVSGVSILVCSACGYMELYARNPAAVVEE